MFHDRNNRVILQSAFLMSVSMLFYGWYKVLICNQLFLIPNIWLWISHQPQNQEYLQGKKMVTFIDIYYHVFQLWSEKYIWHNLFIDIHLKSNDKCPYKRQRGEDMNKRGSPCRDRCRVWSDADTRQGMPGATRSLKKQGRILPKTSRWRSMVLLTLWFWTSSLQKCEDKFMFVK